MSWFEEIAQNLAEATWDDWADAAALVVLFFVFFGTLQLVHF